MTPKKPDRFERIVLAAIKKQDTPESPSIWLNGPDIIKLLRQHHRWMVRMVTQEYERTLNASLTHKDVSIRFGLDCQAAMCKAILALLTRRAK